MKPIVSIVFGYGESKLCNSTFEVPNLGESNRIFAIRLVGREGESPTDDKGSGSNGRLGRQGLLYDFHVCSGMIVKVEEMLESAIISKEATIKICLRAMHIKIYNLLQVIKAC